MATIRINKIEDAYALERKLIEIRKENIGVSFVGLNYTNLQGEVTKRKINVGVSLENAKVTDFNTLVAGIDYVQSAKYEKADWDLAMAELINSLGKEKTQETINRSNGQKDAYIHLANGLKWHSERQRLYLEGMQEEKDKKILEAGTYKEVKSSAKTIAKEAIKKHLKSAKYRTFLVSSIKGELKISGDTIIIEVETEE